MRASYIPQGVILFLILIFVSVEPAYSQKVDDAAIKKMIKNYHVDQRGPYKDLRWFCPDGSVLLPSQRCSQSGGVQRARYKDEVVALQKTNHIFLGQILTTTDFSDFWDGQNDHSWLKQYQLEKYLRSVDNGWILRQAQFYRGAVQAENEEQWSMDFLKWLLARDDVLKQQFFLARQAMKDIPHRGDENLGQLMRSESRAIAEAYPPFMDLRIKIHGQPEREDIERVKTFKVRHAEKLSREMQNKIDKLVTTMQQFFKSADVESLQKYAHILSASTPLKRTFIDFLNHYSADLPVKQKVALAASMIYEIRQNILVEPKAEARVALLDISNALEEIVFKQAPEWKPETLQDLLYKIYNLSLTAAGAGYVERWEWKQVSSEWSSLTADPMNLNRLNRYLQLSRSQTEWGAGMVNATYGDVINTFAGFEPLAQGFLDDRIRSSVLLHLGNSVSRLGDFVANKMDFSNRVMGISNQSRIRGLNPGYAVGTLKVIAGPADTMEVSAHNIYVFERPPSDLKPIAGLVTVSEGNPVSHLQLLARNLGIPNAVISQENVEDLKQYDGEKVFYAVSNQGTVIMKPASQMNVQEKALFSEQQRRETRIRVPVDKIRLDQTSILNLREVRSSDSGVICGPKAANLGQLKFTFPDKVMEGFVIPFGIFREHMDQQMPGREISYWQFLNNIYQEAENMRKAGKTDAQVEAYQLKQLEILRSAMKEMPLKQAFVAELKKNFETILGKSMGKIPVFLRSDTNMEDLKEFTGAGLNLTVFNVSDTDKIIQGIRDVWASPYSERSYKWRQKYLLNPENVYPSILVIPSVDVDYSGVLITKGVSNGDPNNLTVAFSRGAGGAVDGQVAESYLIEPSGQDYLLAPARESYFNRLPYSGGVEKKIASFDQAILNKQNIGDIVALADSIKQVFPRVPGIGSSGPYDVELGFKDNKLWLFQVRPFVENKQALSSGYLESISPKINGLQQVNLTEKLNE